MVNAKHGPLNILIAGAGIGGLSAAITLRRAGHNVQVSHSFGRVQLVASLLTESQIFERSLFNNEYGAAVSIGPNANGLLRGIGLPLENFGGVDTKLVCLHLL